MNKTCIRLNSKGFSLVELIIVIAIMAILAGALAPALIKYIEKSKRTKDMNNAMAIETVLVDAYSEGTIEIPQSKDGNDVGLWVMLCNRTRDKAPNWYHDKNVNGMWCGADKDVVIDGHKVTNAGSYCNELDTFLRKEGVNIEGARSHSNGGSDGWDWVIIQIYGTPSGNVYSRIYSGYSNDNGSINQTSESNIERMMGRSWIRLN